MAGNASTWEEQGRDLGTHIKSSACYRFDCSTNDVHHELACGTSGDGSKSMLG